MPLNMTVTDSPTAEMRNAIGNPLDEFNVTQVGCPLDFQPLAVLLSDPATGEFVGGLYGATIFRYLHVDLLFVPASMRGAGWGRKLLLEAEAQALVRGCHGVWLSTFTFQARGFLSDLAIRCLELWRTTHPATA